jgi:hypothetical protein
LSSTDWNTFNGKASSFTYTTGYIPFGQGTTTPNQSANLFWDNANIRLGVGVSAPLQALHVSRAGPSTYTLITNTGTGPSNFLLGAANAQTQLISRDGTTGAVPLNVLTGSTQVAQFGASDFTVNVGNLVIGTSGKGIDFSATPGTGTSELLDDFEEGTFTATLTASTTAPTTPVTATARYTKIGDLVQIHVGFSGPNTTGASGDLRVTGLPFTSGSQIGQTGAVWHSGVMTNKDQVAYISNASKTVIFIEQNVGSFTAIAPSASSFLRFSLTYFV